MVLSNGIAVRLRGVIILVLVCGYYLANPISLISTIRRAATKAMLKREK